MIKKRIFSVGLLGLSFGIAFSGTAQAEEVVFCVNKSSRIVTFPSYGVCKSDQITLKLPTNSASVPTIKNHTDTAKTEPKQTQKVFVPNVLGMQRMQAQKILIDLNLKVSVKSLNKGNKVVDVVPKIGTQVAPGTVVVLVIG